MPFFAKDWRSPGEAWVKTDDGWEKLKILECRKKFNANLYFKESILGDEKENSALGDVYSDKSGNLNVVQPHCQITIKCTKEVAGFNGLSDALNRLDFHNAVQDYRRFPYIAKLLNLLLSHQRITTLPGCAQKFLLGLLEEIAVQAQASGQNVHVLFNLLEDLRRIVRGDLWWGQPLGSSQLWGQHIQTLDRIDLIASSIPTEQNPSEPFSSDDVKFEDLPEECIRQILFRLADHRDLVNVAEAYAVAEQLSHEQSVWRRLCTYHFSPLQVEFILKQMIKDDEKKSLNRSCSLNAHRGVHPYKERSSRRSPPKENIGDIDDTELGSHGNDFQRVHVSHAFHEHINKNREFLINLQSSGTSIYQRINFQDVRNYLDQRQKSKNRNPGSEKNNNSNCKRKDVKKDPEGTDWEELYHRLRRQFGLREEYAETLYLCRQCRCLFWKSLGHPCILEHNQKLKRNSLYVPVPPEAFLKFFSL